MALPDSLPHADPQLQSRLVCLPMEIKHMITMLCFTANNIVEDPSTTTNSTRRNYDRPRPSLGIALLQTCRRLYYEIDRRPLFFRNVFRFTTADRTKAFLGLLEHEYRCNINDLEIDIRHVHSDQPALARNWLQYLENRPENKSQNSLQRDAPSLKTLRLNFESWPRIPMFRTELWNLLRNLLSNVKGLERIVVIGASKGQAMARRAPWSQAHYVGAENIGVNDLIPQMWKCVEAPDDKKIIRWVRNDGKIHLEVTHSKKQLGRDWPPRADQKMEENGWCDWKSYVSLDSNTTGQTMK